MLTKKTTKKHIGLAITGFGMLFLGMTLMKDAMEPLASSPVFSEWLMNANNPFMAILIGTVITAVIQSSAASIGILQALASQGLIPLHFAAYVIYGQNIGTCITALISSIGTKKNSKRTAVMHVLFNVFGTVIFIILTKLLPFTDWIESLTDNTMMQLSLVHIIFNVVSTLIMFPFADKVLVKLACLIVPDKKDFSEDDFKLQFVDNLMINTPPFAVAQVSKEVHRMAGLARHNFSIAAEDLLNKSCDHFDEVQHTEEVINFLNHNITPILVKINSLDLSYSDAKYIGRVFHVINDIERIGDHAQNLEEAAKSRVDEGIEISAEGERELREMYETTLKLIDGSIEAFTSQILDNEKAEQLSEYEASVDDMQTEFEQSHIERLNAHKCNTRAGMLFINTITDFERVADHATNIAWSVSKKPKKTTD